MYSRWSYILVGNNNTGKTSLQRSLLWHLCGKRFAHLPRNIVTNISHPRVVKGVATLFTSNRSFQEKRAEYKSIHNYFKRFFKDADICVLSSHAHDSAEIAEMIRELKQRCYNVAGVFWSNAFNNRARAITLLPWTEVLWIENSVRDDRKQIVEQLEQIGKEFGDFLIARAALQ